MSRLLNKLDNSLIAGRLLRRYKRFLADIELEDGQIVTAHCPNPGSLLGCLEEGASVYLRLCAGGQRKLKYSWVLVQCSGVLVNIDTQLPNKVVYEALAERAVPSLSMYRQICKEVTFEDSRFDFCLREPDGTDQPHECFIEVKSTTLAESGVAMFPDAPTLRGRKHLAALSRAVAAGNRAVQFYLISRSDTRVFRPASEIDPLYAQALRDAAAAGVEVLAFDVSIDLTCEPYHVALRRPVPVELACD